MRTTIAFSILTAAVGLLGAAPSHAQSDANFVQAALQNGNAEVARATVASNSADTRLRRYAGRIVADYNFADQRLIAIAGSQGISTANGASQPAIAGMTPEPNGGANQTQVTKQAPAPVDYFRNETASLQRTIALYEFEVSGGRNPQLRAYASKALPEFRNDLNMAKSDLSAEQHGGSSLHRRRAL